MLVLNSSAEFSHIRLSNIYQYIHCEEILSQLLLLITLFYLYKLKQVISSEVKISAEWCRNWIHTYTQHTSPIHLHNFRFTLKLQLIEN